MIRKFFLAKGMFSIKISLAKDIWSKTEPHTPVKNFSILVLNGLKYFLVWACIIGLIFVGIFRDVISYFRFF